MTDHEHDWRIACRRDNNYKMNLPYTYCRLKDCEEELPMEQTLAMLNAAEQLSVDIAIGLTDGDGAPRLFSYERDALRAYAKARGVD